VAAVQPSPSVSPVPAAVLPGIIVEGQQTNVLSGAIIAIILLAQITALLIVLLATILVIRRFRRRRQAEEF
jgi:hypothetical protein